MTAEGHPFPEIEPEVTITPRPEADLKEILRTDLGSGFVPLEVGAETKWAFWDWPSTPEFSPRRGFQSRRPGTT